MQKLKKASIIFTIFIFMFSLGCSTVPKPTSVVSNFLENVKNNKLDEAKTYIYNENSSEDLITFDNDEQEKMITSIFSHISYENPVETSVEDDKAIVTVKITSPDLVKVATNVMNEMIPMAFANAFADEEDVTDVEKLTQQRFMNSINATDVPLTTIETKIELKKVDDKWLIVPGDDLTNALTGNLGQAFD